MVNVKEYEVMWDKVNKGEITEKEWSDYCLTVLVDIMKEHDLCKQDATEVANLQVFKKRYKDSLDK